MLFNTGLGLIKFSGTYWALSEVGARLSAIPVIFVCTAYHLLCKMSKTLTMSNLSQVTRAQGDVFKQFILSARQSNTQRYSSINNVRM